MTLRHEQPLTQGDFYAGWELFSSLNSQGAVSRVQGAVAVGILRILLFTGTGGRFPRSRRPMGRRLCH